MSASLKIMVPEATVNFIKNPSIRYDTTGWNAVGCTISRTFEQARFNIASLKVVTNGSTFNEGVYYRVNYLNGTNDNVAISAYVRGTGHVRLRLSDENAGKVWYSKTETLRNDRWTRLVAIGRCSGGDDIRLNVETDEDIKIARTFYVDGAQMEIKPYATSYCDGSQDGCRWDNMDNNSFSLRNVYTRDCGRWVEVVGNVPSDENIYATATTGFAMNERNGEKNISRDISIVFHAKNKDMSRHCDRELSLRRIFELRQKLIDIIKPDAVSGKQPFWMEYKDGDRPIYAKVNYNGGLEGDWDIRNLWIMDFPLRLVSAIPEFMEDNQQTASFDFSDTSIFSGVAGRIDGEWKTMNGGIFNNYDLVDVPLDFVDGTVKDMTVGARGEIYAVGRFAVINYNGVTNPNAVADCAAYWDGSKWVAF